MGVKLALVLSDPHCGSHFGLLPPGVEGFDGHEFRQNDFQKQMWDYWCHMRDIRIPQVTRGDEFILIVNGDLIDGNHHRTKEIVSNEVGDHMAIAETALRPLVDMASKTFVLEGTDSHTGNVEHSIGKRLGAVDSWQRRGSWKELPIEVNGCYGIVRHHISASASPRFESGALGRHLDDELNEAARRDDRIPKWIARAHRHRTGAFFDGYSLVIVTPAWQGRSRWLRNRMPTAMPQFGAWMLDWRGSPEGQLPYPVPILYEPQKTGSRIVTV